MIRRSIVIAAVVGILLTGGVVPLQARDRDDHCRQRVQKAEGNLQNAIRKHGEHSRQAEQRRRQLEQARAACRGDQHGDHDRNDHHDQGDHDRR